MTPPPSDSTERFSDRVADYVRYRPDYPTALAETLVREVGLSASSIVADIGSGTGISTAMFLRHGCTVFAVEPNAEMRRAAEERFAHHAQFHSLAALAEKTTLPDASVDLVASGQAFHWFDAPRARAEFRRILRPTGFVALFWNTRKDDSTAFLRDYERLLQTHCAEYAQVDHRRVDAATFEPFFAGPYRSYLFPHTQTFDFEGLRGRLLSSSYAPLPEHPAHGPMIEELQRIVAKNEASGRVRFEYETQLFIGRI